MAMTAALYAVTNRTYTLFWAVSGSENTVRLGITEHHYHDVVTPCTHYTLDFTRCGNALYPLHPWRV